MRATIDSTGCLTIVPESEIEAYALRCYQEKFDSDTQPVIKFNWGEIHWHRFVRQGGVVMVEHVLSDVEDESRNPWKAEVIDYLVCAFLLNEKNSKDPKRALCDIIDWEVNLALDPLVSERASKLLHMDPSKYNSTNQ